MKYIAWMLIGISMGLCHATPAATTSQTHVRFRFSYGQTRFGDVDVELFDQEKPLTVANFLRYVRVGAYEGNFAHRCVPNVILQGGSGTVGDAYSSRSFEAVVEVPEFAPITNEFLVGPLYHNYLGTLAMAKVQGNPDSATSSWFFNLGDNSSLFDKDNGGFTVFGRVTAGLNVLRTFNSFSLNNAIVNMGDDWHKLHCPGVFIYPGGIPSTFEALPVGFFGVDCVFYSDLFTVQIISLDTGDTTLPTVSILQPAAGTQITTNRMTVTGTAADSGGISAVWVYLNEGPRQLAQGTTSWSLVLTNVPVGTNALDVESVDVSGNHSLLQRRTFSRFDSRPTLSITTQGRANYRLHLAGTPNTAHRLEWSASIPATTWELLTQLTTDSRGVAEYNDHPTASSRFYRVVCP